VQQIGEFASRVGETSKLGGAGFISMFQVTMFTSFNCALVKATNISIMGVPQIGEFARRVGETSKLGGAGFISMFRVAMFT
jgi:hypothetical protein